MSDHHLSREATTERANRLGIEGIEFVEYATTRPQALGQVLEKMGFSPVARHRSREIVLYRQGGMNVVVNAHPDDARVSATVGGYPVISAVALRVRDALKAHTLCVEMGAWEVPSHVRAMELHIPGIRGPGSSRFYFVDRWREFSIYEIDFVAIPTVEQHPPAVADMDFFGLVQYIGASRSADWMMYYAQMFDFTDISDEKRFGIMPKGHLMASPCGTFMWQLVEPDPFMDDEGPECLQRLGLGVSNVEGAVGQLTGRGVEFVQAAHLQPSDKGALTRTELGSVAFELVRRSANG